MYKPNISIRVKSGEYLHGITFIDLRNKRLFRKTENGKCEIIPFNIEDIDTIYSD